MKEKWRQKGGLTMTYSHIQYYFKPSTRSRLILLKERSLAYFLRKIDCIVEEPVFINPNK